MPLSQAAPRKHLHQRQYEMNGYIRDDGLWDIEGRITDVKTYGFDNDYRTWIEAGDPIHDMSIRVTIDDGFIVKAIEAVTDKSPFGICPNITPNFQRMVGARIGPGWRKTIRERLGGVEGCTHLSEMLVAMATVAYQTAYSDPTKSGKKPAVLTPKPGSRPPLINSCHAFADDGAITKEKWPEFYTGE